MCARACTGGRFCHGLHNRHSPKENKMLHRLDSPFPAGRLVNCEVIFQFGGASNAGCCLLTDIPQRKPLSCHNCRPPGITEPLAPRISVLRGRGLSLTPTFPSPVVGEFEGQIASCRSLEKGAGGGRGFREERLHSWRFSLVE